MSDIIEVAPKKEEQKKESKLKKVWTKVKRFFSYYSEEIWIVVYGIGMLIYGICIGWIVGLFDKDNNQEHYNAGKHDGCIQGYRTCVEDLKSSGYQVYGGYGEDCSRMVVTKIIEAPFSADENAVGPLVEEDK